jgi:cytochrome c553
MKYIFSLSVLTLLLLASCGKTSNDSSMELPGRAIFEQQNCGLCHGHNAEGKATAPKLADLEDNWNKDQLVEYLKNPAQYAEEDPRLSSEGHKYPSMMPNYNFVSESDLQILSEYLLAL